MYIYSAKCRRGRMNLEHQICKVISIPEKLKRIYYGYMHTVVKTIMLKCQESTSHNLISASHHSKQCLSPIWSFPGARGFLQQAMHCGKPDWEGRRVRSVSISHAMLHRLRAKNQSMAHNHAVHEVLLFTLLNCNLAPSLRFGLFQVDLSKTNLVC